MAHRDLPDLPAECRGSRASRGAVGVDRMAIQSLYVVPPDKKRTSLPQGRDEGCVELILEPNPIAKASRQRHLRNYQAKVKVRPSSFKITESSEADLAEALTLTRTGARAGLRRISIVCTATPSPVCGRRCDRPHAGVCRACRALDRRACQERLRFARVMGPRAGARRRDRVCRDVARLAATRATARTSQQGQPTSRR